MSLGLIFLVAKDALDLGDVSAWTLPATPRWLLCLGSCQLQLTENLPD